MPDIDSLLEKASKKKFKKSSYRPWNYMEEIQKEEKQQEEDTSASQIVAENISSSEPVSFKKAEVNLEKEINIPEPKQVEIHSPEITVSKIEKVFVESPKLQTYSPLYIILRLSGHQKKIFNFILERCVARGLLSTGIVTSETLTSITNTSLTMVNTSIQRLVEKGIIQRENGKRGRGGFYCFGISQDVKDAAVEYRRITNLDNMESFKIPDTQTSKMEISNFDVKKVTSGLPPEWDELEIDSLAHIGFSKGHIQQLFKHGDIDIISVQDSINYFAYDLKYNNKAASITKASPIAYFMGILKRAGIYTAPENYESPKDKALRELIEHKKNEKEKRDSMMKELINLAFDDWQSKLTQEDKDAFIPAEIKKSKLSAAKQASLKTYFTEKVWPTLASKEGIQ